MRTTEDFRSFRGWTRETLAGGVGALAALPPVLTIGLLAFSPLGAVEPQVALFAAFVTAGIGGLSHAVLSRTSMPVAGPSSATALTLVTLVAQLVADPRLAPSSAAGLQVILALCALAVMLCGALQVGFALLGWARLCRVAPQPVLAGFLNAAALLIVLAQLPLLFGLPLGSPLSIANLRAVHPAALALGLGTFGAIWLVRRRWPRWPAALLVLVAGTAAYALMSKWGGAAYAGATVGALPPAWPWPTALLPLSRPAAVDLLQAHLGQVVLTALALATVGTLESSLNIRAVDQMLHTRHDPGRELVALGCGNIVCGVFGGVPLSATRTRTLATLQAGGRGRTAVLAGPVVYGLLYVFGAPLLAMLALPVLAGIMLMVALGLADRWTGRLLARWWAGDHSPDLALGLGVVTFVVAATLKWGMAVGVALGVLVSLLRFAGRMSRSLVHDCYVASARPSRRIYPATVEARLRPLRECIVVLEIDGPLFFGSGDRLLDEADKLDGACRFLVLDLRRVNAIDESGAMALHSVVARAARRSIQVNLAGLAEGSAPALALRSFAPALSQWPDVDRAIEAAEHHLLGTADVPAMVEVPLAQSSLLDGLDPAQAAVVTMHLQARHMQTGEVLFAEGEPGDRLYVVSKGSVSILSLPDRSGRTQRYLSVSPGMMFGAIAMLDGDGRPAGAVADAPSVVHALTRDALDEICRSHPEVALRLHRNVALRLSQRLRGAPGAWRVGSR